MISSLGNITEDSIQMRMYQMVQKMNDADTDGVAGLSQEELSAIDFGNNVAGASFLNALTQQFDKLDSDGNGQLTLEEMSKTKPPMAMGPPPGLLDSSEVSDEMMDALLESLDSDDNGTVSEKELSSVNNNESMFIEDLINNFDNYDLNSDNELSKEEMKQAFTGKESVATASASSSKEDESSSINFESLSNFARPLVQKLIDSYKDGSLSNLVSSVKASV